MEENSIIKIAVIGAESTGKTKLCEGLSNYFNTTFVPEYSRIFLKRKKISSLNQKDLIKIAKGQLNLEKKYLTKANNILFYDTTFITIKIWSQLEFGGVSDDLNNLNKNSFNDFYLITDNSVPWKKDNLRFNKFSRELILRMNMDEVILSKTPFELIKGIDKKRLENAIKIIEKNFFKTIATTPFSF